MPCCPEWQWSCFAVLVKYCLCLAALCKGLQRQEVSLLTPCKAARVRSCLCVSACIGERTSACLPASPVSVTLGGAEASKHGDVWRRVGMKFEEKIQEVMALVYSCCSCFVAIPIFSPTYFLRDFHSPSLRPCGADVLFTLG